MLFYIARRLAWTILVILAVLFVTFLVFFKLPNGDPALRFAGKSPTEDQIALIRHRLHLDKPFYVEFGYFVKNFVTGDENGWPGLGYSYGNYVSVKSEIMTRAPRTSQRVAAPAISHRVRGARSTICCLTGVKPPYE
jgi:peptide/nickel transport system permease protein